MLAASPFSVAMMGGTYRGAPGLVEATQPGLETPLGQFVTRLSIMLD
jgi:hypothetical protein